MQIAFFRVTVSLVNSLPEISKDTQRQDRLVTFAKRQGEKKISQETKNTMGKQDIYIIALDTKRMEDTMGEER